MISEKNEKPSASIVAIHYQYFKNINNLLATGVNNLFSINFIGNEVWKKIYFVPASAKFSQISKRTDAGIQYTQQLSFRTPGENPDDQPELEKMQNLRVVCRVEYANGTIKLVGSDKIPARFIADLTTDEKAIVSDWKAVSVTNKQAYFLDT